MPEVGHVARRAPTFRVRALPRVERDGDRLLVEDPDADAPQSWNLWTGDILEGLAAGEDHAALLARVAARWPHTRASHHEKTLRRFLFTLHRLGAIEILHEAPRAFRGGRYEVARELGRGGVGIAWLARDTATGAEVVVKRAWDYFAPLATTDALVRAEADVMRTLDHPRIVRALDAFEEDGLLHLVRGFARGQELARWRGTGVGPREVRLALARDLAGTLAHLHERGLLLLDLRPANFFVDVDAGSATLIDVGHCKRLVGGEVALGLPKKGKAHASPGFAAPETYEGRATPRTDVWGFGRLYAFMATGLLPRAGQKARELAQRMRDAGADEADARLVEWLAADDEARRPGSMRDVERALASSVADP